MPHERGLTRKQQRFVREYIIDLNSAQAAIRAGYSARNADKIGPGLLGKSRVSSAITEAMQAREARQSITSDRTLQELAIIAFSDITHYRLDDRYNVALAPDAPPTAMRAVSSVKHTVRTFTNRDGDEVETQHTIEYRLWDKNTALTNLGKHFKLFTDRFELVGPVMDEVRRLAVAQGMTVEEVLAEAEALASGHST